MAVPHAKPGEVIDGRLLAASLAHAKTTTLAKTDALEITRLVVPAGKEFPGHQVPGEITFHCLEGRVVCTAGDATRELEAGQLLYLSGEQRHSLRGIDDASVLLTILLR